MAASLLTDRALGWFRGPCLAGEPEETWAKPIHDRVTRQLVRQLLSEGATLTAEGRWQQALERYEKAAVLAPQAPEVKQALASGATRPPS